MGKSVYPARKDFSNLEMTVIGNLIFAGLLVLALPLLPFILLLWLYEKATSPSVESAANNR
ncbi:DUF7535 family protein [Halomarina rubra]|uniref:DUF7535 family protein n=1 Tax=Halomarina rubra TaxID=2071873 RepID=UPI003F76E245